MSSQHRAIWQGTAAQQDAVSSYKTVMPDVHWFATLPRLLKIDRVRQNLRAETSKRSECPDRHLVRAVNQMTVGDGRVAFDD